MKKIDALRKIHGISSNRYEILMKHDIQSLSDFLSTDTEQLASWFNTENLDDIEQIKARIKLYSYDQLAINQEFTLPVVHDVIFFDLEANPSKSKDIYLVSFLSTSQPIITYYKDNSRKFFADVLVYLSKSPKKYLVASSGNNWDFKHLQNQLEQRFRSKATRVMNKFQSIDLMKFLSNKITTPVGFSVKHLSEYLGYKNGYDPLTDPRTKKLQAKYPEDKLARKTGYYFGLFYKNKKVTPEIKQAMILYNQSDVHSLQFIYHQLQILSNKGKGIHHIE